MRTAPRPTKTIAFALGLLAVSCTASPASIPSPTSTATVAATTAAPTRAAATTAAVPAASIVALAPTGFVLPQTCSYVGSPVVGVEQTDWRVDCGAAGNRNIRGTLGSALAQQGWTSCGSGLATAQWWKNDVMLGIAESSLAPGDYPRLTQLARATSPCR